MRSCFQTKNYHDCKNITVVCNVIWEENASFSEIKFRLLTSNLGSSHLSLLGLCVFVCLSETETETETERERERETRDELGHLYKGPLTTYSALIKTY